MINAIISTNNGTLILDFPRSIYDTFEKMQSVGIQKPPNNVYLADGEEDPVQVKLFSENDLGKHLIHTLNENNTIADANLLAFMVQNASEDIRRELELNILADQYHSMQEVVEDIRQMTYDSGPVKIIYYCPLTGNIDEGVGDLYTVGNSFLRDYTWTIAEAIEKDFENDAQNMAGFFDEDANLKSKIASICWGIETYRGRLFGKIECSLKEELTEKEDIILREWITGQNFPIRKKHRWLHGLCPNA